jgi:carotenoid 1,2-hydratase
MNPAFNFAPHANGYAWWYLDGLSDDGRHGITVIAMLGNVFSPFYAAARRRGSADPMDHCAINVALYGPPGKRWALSEHKRGAVRQSDTELVIARSSWSWRQDGLVVHIDESGAPLPRPLKGRIRLRPDGLARGCYPLDAAGQHRWHPWAPCARLEVEFEAPAINWSGRGYADANSGDGPLEEAFAGWHWSRAPLRGGDTAVLYEIEPLNAAATPPLALRFRAGGGVTAIEVPPRAELPATGWRLARATRCDHAGSAKVLKTLEDTPFYARSLLATQLQGEAVMAMHESLSLARFRSRWVQRLLPFRMRREIA